MDLPFRGYRYFGGISAFLWRVRKIWISDLPSFSEERAGKKGETGPEGGID
jgi:hypothetical protein